MGGAFVGPSHEIGTDFSPDRKMRLGYAARKPLEDRNYTVLTQTAKSVGDQREA